jgi:hypothetical protein
MERGRWLEIATNDVLLLFLFIVMLYSFSAGLASEEFGLVKLMILSLEKYSLH